MFRIHLFILIGLALLGSGSSTAQTPATVPSVEIIGTTVVGNRVTKEHIILRELVVKVGDTLGSERFYERLERSRQNLMNTGLFNTVAVLPLYIDQRTVIVEVTVNERWYLWPAVVFDLADPNFNTWWLTKDLSRVNYGVYLYRYNFRGLNETVYAMAQFGYAQRFALHYKAPYIDRRQRWGINVGGGYLQQSEVTTGTVDNKRILLANPDGPNRTERYGEAELTLRRNHDVRHHWRLGYIHADVTDTVVASALDYFDGLATSSRFLSFGYTFIWDRRDVRFFPRSGHYFEARVDRHGLGLLDRNAPDITTVYATGKRWWQMHDKITLALSLRGKYTFGTPPYYAQEGLGYGHFVRGYEYYVVDGEHFTLGRANFVFQLVRPRVYRLEAVPLEAFRTLHFALYAHAFADAGRVWDGRYAAANFLANGWLSGYGVGLDLVSSYDQVIRGEYSFNALGEHGFFLHFSQPF